MLVFGGVPSTVGCLCTSPVLDAPCRQRKKPSLARAMLRAFRWRFMTSAALLVCFMCALTTMGGKRCPFFFWRFKTGEMSRSWLKCKVAKFSFRVFSKENWSIWDLGDIFICLQNPHCLAQKKWGWDGGAKHAKLKSLWIIHERQAERFMRRPFSLELFRCIMPSGYGNRHGKLPTAVAP